MPDTSPAIVPTICNVGLAAVLRSQGDGLEARIAAIAIGRGLANGASWKGYEPARTMTALAHEDVRVPILSGVKLDNFGFRILARVPPAAAATEIPVFEVGWFLETGELLCLWSHVAGWPLTTRTPLAGIDLAHELYLSQVPLSALSLAVTEPDIPDTAGVLAYLLADQTRQLIGEIKRNYADYSAV